MLLPRLAAVSAATFLFLACGSPPPAATPTESASSSTDDDDLEAAPPEPEPAVPNCSDQSCLECGDGICPNGAYCQVQGTTKSCAWLSECAGKPSCSCVLGILGKGCSCADGPAGPTVECSP